MLRKYLTNRTHISFFSVFIISCACIFPGCASRHSYPKITVPASAYAVTTARPDSNQYGITFSINAGPFSYQYFDDIGKQLFNNGYNKCTKSAISKWQVMPGQTSEGDNWMVAMFTTKKRDKFVVLRVEQLSVKAKEKSTQKFSIAFQDISHGTRNLSNISEFCDLQD